MAFVVGTFSRRIVGWSAATVKETVFVLDALEMAIWQRDRDQHPVQPGELIHHSDAWSQYTSFRLAEHLDAAGIAASIGSVGDAYDCQSSRTGSRKDQRADGEHDRPVQDRADQTPTAVEDAVRRRARHC
ncbi:MULTISPECIES: DDE-type integrase/transposase/recombinase [Streptomyces]|uniref:Integrase catalytic domain-containing protein n=1 Tax=Streptomyces virginiae TaxID=1961 RepID=A0ABZ1THP4_STRVG|nr:DDE-type integrase/transposase/recombinase [Streptomyces virginiae]WTB24381.1 hypothetical protein OG253_24445 [Streptomyces virginiae]